MWRRGQTVDLLLDAHPFIIANELGLGKVSGLGIWDELPSSPRCMQSGQKHMPGWSLFSHAKIKVDTALIKDKNEGNYPEQRKIQPMWFKSAPSFNSKDCFWNRGWLNEGTSRWKGRRSSPVVLVLVSCTCSVMLIEIYTERELWVGWCMLSFSGCGNNYRTVKGQEHLRPNTGSHQHSLD